MTETTVAEPLVLKLWMRAVWPVLAVPVIMLGLIMAALQVGVLTMVVSFSVMVLVAWVGVWTVVRDLPGLRRRTLHIAVGCGFGFVVMAGWTEITPATGAVVPLLVAATSPPAVRGVLGLVRKVLGERSRRPSPPQRVLMDREMVDRRFEELVKNLEESGDNRDG